jgi:hypothetical protein
VLLRLAYLALTGVVTFLRLLPMSSTDKDIEILALRHQLAVLQRRVHKPRFTPPDRAFLAALLHSIPRPTLQEVHGQDGLGLGGEELAPGRSRSARRRVQARVVEDLPHRGSGDLMAEPNQFTLHPPWSQVGFSAAMRITRFLIAAAVGGRPGRRRAV